MQNRSLGSSFLKLNQEWFLNGFKTDCSEGLWISKSHICLQWEHVSFDGVCDGGKVSAASQMEQGRFEAPEWAFFVYSMEVMVNS